MRIPDDISICSFDGYESGGKLDPPLTVMKQDLYGIGRLAAKTMIDIYQKGGMGCDVKYEFKYSVPTIFIENKSVCHLASPSGRGVTPRA